MSYHKRLLPAIHEPLIALLNTEPGAWEQSLKAIEDYGVRCVETAREWAEHGEGLYESDSTLIAHIELYPKCKECS